MQANTQHRPQSGLVTVLILHKKQEVKTYQNLLFKAQLLKRYNMKYKDAHALAESKYNYSLAIKKEDS